MWNNNRVCNWVGSFWKLNQFLIQLSVDCDAHNPDLFLLSSFRFSFSFLNLGWYCRASGGSWKRCHRGRRSSVVGRRCPSINALLEILVIIVTDCWGFRPAYHIQTNTTLRLDLHLEGEIKESEFSEDVFVTADLNFSFFTFGVPTMP